MPTDDERRAVARRLRENAKYVSKYDDIDCVLNDILRGEEKQKGVNEDCTVCRRATLVELADLIEPHEPYCIANVTIDGEELERIANKAVKEAIGIDRGALLELAGEFDEKAETIARHIESSDGDFDRHAIDAMEEQCGYARRIREACGEVGR